MQIKCILGRAQALATTDAERQQSLQEAIEEYERLIDAFSSLDYKIEVLPKTGVIQRADQILKSLKLT